MAWTATLEKKESAGNGVRIVIRYSNGTDEVREEYTLTSPRPVADIARRGIAELTKLDEYSASLTEGGIDTTAPVEPTPTQAELDEREFIRDWHLHQRMKRAVDAGIVPATNTAYVNLTNKLKANFINAYFKSM